MPNRASTSNSSRVFGYFFADPVDSKPGKPVFNRTTSTLRDTWAKEAAKE